MKNLFETNKNKLTPMMVQYVQIKEAYKDMLLLYRMGDFYEMFFEDAIIGSEILGIALTQRGKIQDEKIPMCGVPFHSVDTYLTKLINNGIKVAICEQSETVDKFKERGGKGPLPRSVVRVITPGTIQEDKFLDPKINNFLTSISSILDEYAVAWADMSTGLFKVQCCTYKEVVNILHLINPSEIIICEESFKNFKKLEDEFIFSCQPDLTFDLNKGETALKELYEIDDLTLLGIEKKEIISATGGLLNYLKSTQIDFMPRLEKLEIVNKEDFMTIDFSARKSLELIFSQKNEKKGSLLHCIDKTITSGGSRLLSQRISSPLINKTEINKRLDLVEFFLDNYDLTKQVTNILSKIGDIERCLSRIVNNRGGPRDLFLIGLSLKNADLIGQLLQKNKNIINKVMILLSISELHKNLLDAIEENSLSSVKDGNFIKDGFSITLDKARKFRDESKIHITSLEKKYIQSTGISSLKIKFNNVLGYHIEVRAIHGNRLLNDENFHHRQTTAQAFRFSTEELIKMENDINFSRQKILNIELGIFEELVSKIKSNLKNIYKISSEVAKIDVATSSAILSFENDFCKPIINDDENLNILEGRHPVVELSNKKNNKFIVNSCILSDDNNIWLLTGPNMAGKSTFLRQNAIIIILAQAGLYVPAKIAEIGIVDKLFSRVGASDDLAKGQSTFMIEMIETAYILNQATKKSFVIMDEIGRGTATWDGLAIAWACLEHVHEKIKCRTIFATHYHELTTLKDKLKRLTPYVMSVKEWNSEVIFLYKIIKGVAKRSYGIHVAKIAGIPEKVVSRANDLLKLLERKTILNLEENKTQIDFNFENNLDEIIRENEFSEVIDHISQLNPDTITPKEALEKIYELKALIAKK